MRLASGEFTALDAIEHQVDLLSDEEALKLLATCSGQCKEMLSIEAHEVVKECGNLPLALSMTGAIAQGRPNRWDNLLYRLRNADLEKIRHQFPDYPYPDLLKAIQVSVDALEPEVKVRYLDFAVFPEDTAIPEATLKAFWEPEGLDEYDTQDVIDTLVQRSLARRDEAGNLSLHDLQYNYVRKQIIDLPALHNKLLDAYAKLLGVQRIIRMIQEPHHRVDALAELCIAFVKIGRKNDAGKILAEARKVPQITVDLTRSIGVLCGVAKVVAQRGHVHNARVIFEQAKTSIEDITDHIESSCATYLLATNLAQANYFFEEAELAAKQIHEQSWRSAALQELAVALSTQKHFPEAERIAHEIENTQFQIEALSQLVIALNQAQYQQKINEAKVSELLRLITDKAETPQELKIIVKTLSKIGFCNEAERVASSIQEFVPREEALANVAITLAQLCDTPNAERILKNLKQNWLRVEILKVLVVELTDTNYLQSNAFLSEALQEAESIKEVWRQSKTLGDLAVALIQAGCAQKSEMIFSKAKETAQAAINFWLHPNRQTRSNESEVYRWLSEALAKAERFTEALNIFSSIEASAIYSSQEVETFLILLVNWAENFESADKNISLTVLQEAVRIAGWVYPQWQDIYELMRFSEARCS